MIRLVNWNIQHGKGNDGIVDIHRVGKLLLKLGATVYAIQEIDVGLKRSGGINQFSELEKILGMKGYFTNFWDKEIKNTAFKKKPTSTIRSPGGSYGLATFSNLHVISTKNILLAPNQENTYLQKTTFKLDNSYVDLINLHAPTKNNMYWKKFYKTISFSDSIICGDFNIKQNNKHIVNMLNTHKCINEKFTHSSGVIDYAMVPIKHQIIKQHTLFTNLSDHHILVTDILPM
jgi:endonuclease/exonuclease/phosphatase family metal-dependent hydrolase